MRSKSTTTPNKSKDLHQQQQEQQHSLLLSEVNVQLKSSSSSIQHSEWKTHRQFPIGITKKEIFIGHRGNYYIKLHTIQNMDEIQIKIETILDDLRERNQRRNHNHNHHRHYQQRDDHHELIIECKKGIFHCFLPMSTNHISIITFMKYFQKVLDKVQSKTKKRNNKKKNMNTYADSILEDGYEYEYDDMSSFTRTKQQMKSYGRTIPTDATSANSRKRSLSPFQQRQHELDSLYVQQHTKRTKKTIKTYSSKNTKLNIMKQRAQERDYDRFKNEDEFNNEQHEQEEDIQLEDEEEEKEDDDLHREDDHDGGQYGNDDSMYDNDHDDHDDYNRNENSIDEDNDLNNDDYHYHDDRNMSHRSKSKNVTGQLLHGRRRLMKKTRSVIPDTNSISSSIENHDNNTFIHDLNDSDDDDEGIQLSKKGQNDDDDDTVPSTMTTTTRPLTSIAAVSPTQLDSNHDLNATNKMMKSTDHDTITDDDQDNDDNDETSLKHEEISDDIMAEENQNDSNHVKTHNIQSFFGPKVKCKSKRGKAFATSPVSSKADRLLGMSSVPEPSLKLKSSSPMRKTPPRSFLQKKSFSSSSPTSSTTLESSKLIRTTNIKNPYKSSPLKNTTDNSCHHIGLRNLGNTCYINASLQMLFSLPDFIFSLQQTYDEIIQKQTKTSSQSTPMPITRAFLKVAWDAKVIKSSDGVQNPDSVRTVDPFELKEAIDFLTNKFAGYEQRDSHEFVSALIDYIHEELVNMTEGIARGQDEIVVPTDEYFKLNVKVCLTCDSCNYRRCKEELYRHLSIEVGQSDDEKEDSFTVNKSLDKFFVPETREVRCEKCNCDTATQTTKVLSRPKAILLHLKRFIVSGQSIKKNKGRIQYDKALSLEQFCDENIKKDAENNANYNLCGIVRHIGGTASSGHYTANCERMKKNMRDGSDNRGKEWVSFDDGVATMTSLPNVVNNEQNQRSVYMMLYELGEP